MLRPDIPEQESMASTAHQAGASAMDAVTCVGRRAKVARVDCRLQSKRHAGKHASCLLDADRERTLIIMRAECCLANGDYSAIGLRSVAIQGHGIAGSQAIALNWWLAITLFQHLK